MIYPAIDTIRNELKKRYNDSLHPLEVELDNIGEILSDNSHEADTNIIISLVNIEENRVSRDPQNYARHGTELRLKNPAVSLYLTLLFTSVGSYAIALGNLQRVIEFFQEKYVFDKSNTTPFEPGIEKLILEMLSLNLEQLQQMWSMLGGKYHPSVAYKVRMVNIDSETTIEGKAIKEIEIRSHKI